MREVGDFLKANPIVHLATCDEGQPRVRPFQFMLVDDGKFYFCTGASKDVYKQLQANPKTELSVMAADGSWLRLSGKVVFVDNRELKQTVLDCSDLVKSVYKSPDNPELVLLYIEAPKAGIYDFSGNPPRFFG